MKRILRYPEDRWPLAYTLMVLAVQLGLFFAVDNLWVTVLCVLLFQPVQAVAIACNHYQHHVPVFRVRWLNRAYETILFLQTGTPPYLITLHHNLGHHPNYLKPEQDTLRWQRPEGSPRGLFECLVKNFAGHLTWTIAIGRRYPKIYRRLKIMTVVSLATLAVLIYLDPAKAMIVFVGPMLLAIFNVARLGYDQHAGLEMDDHLHASRNKEGWFYNLVTFNSGYHTAHHVNPGLHWSKLPEFHRQIRDGIPAELR
ncbi:MAG TPA: fatty acid desaturase [Thermoanaerobaculia bacterium]